MTSTLAKMIGDSASCTGFFFLLDDVFGWFLTGAQRDGGLYAEYW